MAALFVSMLFLFIMIMLLLNLMIIMAMTARSMAMFMFVMLLCILKWCLFVVGMWTIVVSSCMLVAV